MKFKEILNESENVVVTDWLQQVEQTYKKYFPKSSISVELENYMGWMITIRPYIAKDRSEVTNGIMGNDMLRIVFFIHDPIIQKDENGVERFVGDFVLTADQSSFVITPENRFLAFSAVKVPFRKTKGSPDKILKTFDKYFAKLKDMLETELKNDNIHKDHVELLKTKI